MVQEAFAGSEPPLSVTVLRLAASVVGEKPLQPAPVTVTAPPVVTSPAGNESVKVAPVSATEFGLAITNCIVALVDCGTAACAKDFAIDGRVSRVADPAATFVTLRLFVNESAATLFV